CVGRPPTAPAVSSRLEVFVEWRGSGLENRRLEIVELGLAQVTDANGNAAFRLPAGSYTLRAFVNRGGPPRAYDQSVITRAGETERVEVWDCVPCMSPS